MLKLESTQPLITRLMTSSELIPRSLMEPSVIRLLSYIRFRLAAVKSGLNSLSVLHLVRILLAAVSSAIA